MRSIKFPDMFNTNSTNVWKTSEYKMATYQNTTTLLNCVRNELLGDPYFGTLLKTYLFEQNGFKIKDIIVDLIYTQLVIFIPQLRIDRKDIEVYSGDKKGTMICKFWGTNQIDYQPDMYNITLMTDSNEQQ